MKKLIAASLLLGMATMCGAREPLPAPPSFPAPTGPVYFQPDPTPADIAAPTAMAPVPTQVVQEYAPGTILHAAPVSMYHRVRVVQGRKIHPCAVPMVVAVQNPDRHDACCCPCVYVEICVPPCDVTCIKCNCSGNRVSYEFGSDYAVNLISRNGVVIVNYDN